MKKHRFSHIRKWLLLYLAIVLLTTMGLYVFIFVEITDTLSLLSTIDTDAFKSVGGRTAPAIASIELRLLFIFTVGLILSTILGYIWIGLATRYLGMPVKTIAIAMSKLAKGQLNETVAVDTSDEFEQIGSNINEVAANLQELLLYIWKQTGQCYTLLDHIYGNLDLHNEKRLTMESIATLKQLHNVIDDLREMVKVYAFYDVRIENANTYAIGELGNQASPNQLPSNY